MIYLDNTTQSQQVYIPRQVIQTATTREINNITSGDVINIVDEKLEPYYTSAETDTQIENAVAAESARCEETYSKISDIPDVSDFVTSADVKTQVEDYNYVNSADVKTQIEDYHYITSGDLPDVSEFITSGQAQEQINQSLSGYATEQWVEDKHYLTEHQSLSAYSTTEQIEGMIANESARTEETYAKISDIPDVSDLVTKEEFNELSGTVIGLQQSLSGFASEEYVDNAVNGAIDYVDNQFSSYSQEFTGYLAEKQDITAMTAYYTSAETDTAIENAIAIESARCESTYLKEHQSLAGLFNSVDYVSSAKTIVFYDKTNTQVGVVDATDFIKDGMVDNVYISGETLFIVFNTDAGKETIELDLTQIFDANNYYTKDDIDNKHFVNSGEVKTQIEAYNYVNSGDVETQIDGNLSAYTPTSNFATINGSAITEGGNIIIEGGGGVDSGLTERVDEIEEVTSRALNDLNTRFSAYTPTSGFATINGSGITDGGNIDIQGGGGGNANIIELTQAEYDALSAYTEDALYVITDAEEVDLNDYATSADVATKADKANVAANSQMKFPTWNSQGIITGTTGNTLYQNKQFMLNGSVADTSLISTNTYTFGGFYAPTIAGSSGQILQSNGSGAPSWSSFKFWYGSQNDYDAITTKNSTTIYFIID